MSDNQLPTYRFEFEDGIATNGIVHRTLVASSSEFTEPIGYLLDDSPLVRSLGRLMPDVAADLIDVCGSVWIADRLALRQINGDPRPPNARWHRRLHLVVPVRRPERWHRPEVMARLEALVSFLTGDVWTFAFGRRSCVARPPEAYAQARLLSLDGSAVTVALHSGGLDSLLGLIQFIRQPTAEFLVPVTITSSDKVGETARAVVDHLYATRLKDEPELLAVQLKVEIAGHGRSLDDREPSCRARSMLFLGAAVATAATVGSDRIRLTENGVGAIGLPMASDHWGTRASKSMHPKSLVLFAELVSLVLDQAFAIENSALFATNGHLARRLLGSGRFVAAAQATASCDRLVYLGAGRACGRCSSCILRRMALIAASIDHQVDELSVAYETDWLDPATDLAGEKAVHLFAMRDQVERLRAAITIDPSFDGLDRAFPELLDVVALAPMLGRSKDAIERDLIRLYRDHVGEFDLLLRRIDRPGWGRRADVFALTTPTMTEVAG